MIELTGITKTFPGVKSLDKVDFEAQSGETHALLGENGAGKSTLIKVLAGAYIPDEGSIRYDGIERRWTSPKAAKEAGIYTIYQELVLFPELSVAENIFMGRAPKNWFGAIDYGQMYSDASEVLNRFGHDLDPRTPIHQLSLADQQMVEIAKSLVGNTKLLVLDEPTALISGSEAKLLFECINNLRANGVCIIYISHRLEEIFELADRVTVLKDGQKVATRSVSELNRDRLIALMVGRELDDIYPVKVLPPKEPAPVLSVRNVKMPPTVKDVSFDVYAGEVVGMAGLVGSGRSDLAHAIFGSLPRVDGVVTLAGETFNIPTPRTAIDRGLGFLTEDRKGQGLLMQLDLASNISAPVLREFTQRTGIDRHYEIQAAQDEIQRFRIAVPTATSAVNNLSGGNQQKILFARWSRVCHRVLILDEPTRGVDVGAKVEIYQIIRKLADEGVGILVISSELPEIIGLCTRALVMREGTISGEVTGDQMTETTIMSLATASVAA